MSTALFGLLTSMLSYNGSLVCVGDRCRALLDAARARLQETLRAPVFVVTDAQGNRFATQSFETVATANFGLPNIRVETFPSIDAALEGAPPRSVGDAVPGGHAAGSIGMRGQMKEKYSDARVGKILQCFEGLCSVSDDVEAKIMCRLGCGRGVQMTRCCQLSSGHAALSGT
jgi:hypothetical protein